MGERFSRPITVAGLLEPGGKGSGVFFHVGGPESFSARKRNPPTDGKRLPTPSCSVIDRGRALVSLLNPFLDAERARLRPADRPHARTASLRADEHPQELREQTTKAKPTTAMAIQEGRRPWLAPPGGTWDPQSAGR